MKTKASFVTIVLLFIIVRMLTLAQTALSLASVSPDTVMIGHQMCITINGSGFIEETTVQLRGIGTVSDIFANDSTLTMDLPQTILAGTYSMTVSNPNGNTATVNNALTVTIPPTATVEPVIIAQSEAIQITSGQSAMLSVMGSGFTSNAVVRLVGYGLLETTVVHSGAITATIPANVPVGQYIVELSDSSGNVVQSPNILKVIAPATAIPTALSLPTPITVTTIPSLAVSNFVATPSTIIAGQSTNLSFTVQNRGNQVARTIVVTLGNSSQFVASGGQASINIPDLAPNATYTANMTVTATQEVVIGANSIPLRLSYRDIAGEVYTTDATLSVTIAPSINQSQIVIDAYAIEPQNPEPGDYVTVHMTLSNHGNTTASQVAVRFTGADELLLPSSTGDTFVVGDLQAGSKAPLQVLLILSTKAEAGAQLQAITIGYIQNGEVKEVQDSITVNVAKVDKPQARLLLANYDTGVDILQPGMRFTLNIALQNVGLANATATTVTFGTVQSNGGTGDPNNPDDGSQTNNTPSSTFAPLGTAGLSYIGDILPDITQELSQGFIVAGDVASGIYSLPITLQYSLPDGSNKQESLNLSLVVIAPPRLRFNPQNPLPEIVNASEPVSLNLEILNLDDKDVDLTEARVTASNSEILDGAIIQLESLAADDNTSLMATIMPVEEGMLEVTISLHYINDLGQNETIELVSAAEVMPAPEPVDEVFEPEPVIEEPAPEVNLFGRVIMALMGLGS